MAEDLIRDVDIESKACVYFDGKIVARMCYRKDGSRFAVGVVTPGCYTFEVGDREVVHVTAGEVEILMPGEKDWERVVAPGVYRPVANSQYQVKTEGIAEYLCEYFKD